MKIKKKERKTKQHSLISVSIYFVTRNRYTINNFTMKDYLLSLVNILKGYLSALHNITPSSL